MDKNYIISEIKRAASENGGIALGWRKFQKISGIKEYAWKGKYWRTWGDALKEAGLVENAFGKSHDTGFLIDCLAKLTQHNAKFPSAVDLRLARNNDEAFPSEKSFRKLGGQTARIELVRAFASEHKKYSNILSLLPDAKKAEEIVEKQSLNSRKTKEGYVYLGILKIDTKKRYKIGKTNLVERRNNELSLQLPAKMELVHSIKTDDMSGIESYWHKRFADKRTNGEWFDLSGDEVRAFRLRKFM
jgi:hypothetical protein